MDKCETGANFVIGATDIGESFDEFLEILDDDNDSFALLRQQLQNISTQQVIAPADGVRKEKKKEQAIKYELTKKEAGKWTPAIREIAEAEQKIFGAPVDLVSTVTDIAGAYRPVGNFEADLLKTISAAGATEEAAKAAHALRPAPAIHNAAMAAKRAKLRNLLRYEQQRNVRIRKIKSKAFRHIARKNRLLETARLMQTLEAEDPEMAASIRAEFDEKRATLRMMKKHAARKQWGRLAQRFGGKEAVAEFDRHMQEAAAEKQAVNRIVKSNFESSDESDSSDDADHRIMLKDVESSDSDDRETKGLDSMPFMRNGIMRKRQEMSFEATRKEISRVEKKVAKLVGTDEYQEEGETADPVAGKRLKRRAEPKEDAILAAAAKLAEDQDSTLSLLAKQNFDAHVAKRKEADNRKIQHAAFALDDDNGNIETDKPFEENLKIETPKKPHKKGKLQESEKRNEKKNSLWSFRPARHCGVNLNESVADLISDLNEKKIDLLETREQEVVIRAAFANEDEDGALAELQKLENEEDAQAKLEIDKNMPMPGWGSWTGAGLKIKNEQPVEQTQKRQRVFISRKLDPKVSAMLQQRQTPFLFSNKAHYDAAHAQPLGPEWNTAAVHKRLVQPKVAIRPGTVIQPLRYSKTMNEEQLDSLLDSWGSQRKRITKTRL